MSTQREFANQLSSILMQIEDLKIEAKAIVDAAAEAGVNTKALPGLPYCAGHAQRAYMQPRVHHHDRQRELVDA